MHFGEYPAYYEKILKKYFEESELYPENGVTLDFYKIKFRLLNNDLKEMSEESLGLEIRNDHREFLKRNLFNWCDLRNFYLIRYFIVTTKGTCSRLFPFCGCWAENTPEHRANECTRALKNRSNIIKEFDSLFYGCGLVRKSNVYDCLREVFFCLEKVPAKILRKLIELMKSTIREIIVNDCSVDSRFINQVDDPIQPDAVDEKDVSLECDPSVLDDESTCD